MIFLAISKKIRIFPLFRSKAEKLFAYTEVSRHPTLFYGNFCMNLYFVHRYKFLLSVKRFITVTFYFIAITF
jgi:hypothetical protein